MQQSSTPIPILQNTPFTSEKSPLPLPTPKAILTYWHQVEFFQPYPLQDKIDRGAIRYLLYPRQVVDDNLPWLNKNSLLLAGGLPQKNYSYHLYLGLFDQSELSCLATTLFSNASSETEHIEWEERLMQEGKTCIAKLTLDPDGAPDWNRLSLSTLPWALGKLQKKRQEQIKQKVYEEETEILNDYIRRISLKQGEKSLIFDTCALLELCQGLFNWAQFFPERQPLLAVELKERKRVSKEQLLADLTTQLPILQKEEEGGEEQEEPDLGILNSFYIRDLERAIRSYSTPEHLPETSGQPCTASQNSSLDQYLQGEVSPRIDLASPEGTGEILRCLHPRFSLLGRWPSRPSQCLNLMQQFSLHTLFDRLKEGGLYSINGPPGTGKTTLIREIIAENIVRRAQLLSSFSTPYKALGTPEKISFGAQKSAWVRPLHPSLVGFEMVIASSNNTAVENLSRELPRKKGVSGEVGYLTPVMNKILAPHDRSGQVKPLSEKDRCWGLIAAALGNLRNCRSFLEKGFILKADEETKTYQTVWEWADHYKGISFQEAKDRFLEILQDVEASKKLLADFWDLHLFYSYTTEEAYLQEEEELCHIATLENKLLREKKDGCEKSLFIMREALLYVDKKLESLHALKPPWYSFQWHQLKIYRKQKRELHKERIGLIDRVAQLQEEFREHEVACHNSEQYLLSAQKAYSIKKEHYEREKIRYKTLSEKVQGVPMPPPKLERMDPEMHYEAFWQTEELNEKKSQLFAAALQLHEAWLAVVLKKGGGFRGNLVAVCRMLSGNTPTCSTLSLQIWQSLFMLVPVVSSTFASFSRLFRDVSSSQLGWVIIDEAGQAIPQAAVGAIWRAKRVVALGDPLQIEPVITIPPSLVEAVGRFHLGSFSHFFAPTLTSVQRLADAANPIGVFLPGDEERIWVGSPLRVHRRCQDPMFTIANRIAYAGGMVKQREEGEVSYPESCWYHMTGKAIDRQYVQEQGIFVARQVEAYYQKTHTLPPFYIISPFRRVRSRIASLLLAPSFLSEIARKELFRWVYSRIGTVHTFQGKEEEAVFLVLGGDHEGKGSVMWASQKPNLLNVAVTRAKRRLYVVGDVKLWGGRPFFETAARLLPVVDVE